MRPCSRSLSTYKHHSTGVSLGYFPEYFHWYHLFCTLVPQMTNVGSQSQPCDHSGSPVVLCSMNHNSEISGVHLEKHLQATPCPVDVTPHQMPWKTHRTAKPCNVFTVQTQASHLHRNSTVQ
eukprot:TRINITY_DN511_c0_g1_i1.p1 TRINITY_DN511_c0_g1~~TRINITY_DN511_c0_g1_i1.p1  ORF type:complete len:122 (+),score=15.32 TRINITY_DN511_c0_g1_i1:922-1287(+)